MWPYFFRRLRRAIITIFAISLFVFVAVWAFPSIALAGPWAPEPGHGYAKLWLKYLYGFDFHAGDGNTYGYPSYHELFLATYVEVGLVDRLAMIVHADLARERRLDADHRSNAGRRFGRIAVAPAPVIAGRLAGGAGLLAHLRQLLGRTVAIVGLAATKQLVRNLGMPAGTRELHRRLPVPLQPEPAKAVEDRLDRRLGRTLPVRILDAQQELAAGIPRECPAEQRGARAADMEIPRGRRSEACNGLFGHGGRGCNHRAGQAQGQGAGP